MRRRKSTLRAHTHAHTPIARIHTRARAPGEAEGVWEVVRGEETPGVSEGGAERERHEERGRRVGRLPTEEGGGRDGKDGGAGGRAGRGKGAGYV